MLRKRLTDDNPIVRGSPSRALWLLWSRSGDETIDVLMAKGAEEMQARELEEAIATYSEVIRRKPAFAEGWNKRARCCSSPAIQTLARRLRSGDEAQSESLRRASGYGQIYFQLKQYDKAISYWKRALKVNPNLAAWKTTSRSPRRCWLRSGGTRSSGAKAPGAERRVR